MIYTTHQIATTNADGKDVVFRLRVDLESEPSIEKLPLVGYKLTFQLSRYGFGGLNRTLRLEILDEAEDTFFDFFNDNLRNDVRVEIWVDDDLFMIASPDYEQLEPFVLKDNKRVLRVALYEAFQFKKNINYLSQEVISQVLDLSGDFAAEDYMIRVERLFRELFFDDYKGLTPDERLYFVYNLFITSGFFRTKGSVGDLNERDIYSMLNYTFIRDNVYSDIEPLTGTISASEAHTTVTGTGTEFTTELNPGDFIYDEKLRLIGEITSISSDTTLTLAENALLNVSGSIYFKNFDRLQPVTVIQVLDRLSRALWFRYGFSIKYNNILISQINAGERGYLEVTKTYDPEIDVGTTIYRDSDLVLRNPPLTGTITSSVASATVTGTDTLFTQELAVNDEIHIIDEYEYIGQVQSIESDTSLTLTSTAINNATNEPFTNDLNFETPLPVLEKDGFRVNTTRPKLNEYRTVTYTRLGEGSQANPVTSTRKNTLSDLLLYDDYTERIEFSNRIGSPGNRERTGIWSLIASNVLSAMFMTDRETSVQGAILEVLSQLHARWRFDKQANLKGVYRGLLDPMLPHRTNFRIGMRGAEFTNLVEADGGEVADQQHTNDVLNELNDADLVCPCSAGKEGKLYFRTMSENAYIITRGEYDLLRGETIINESISLFEIEEET